MLKVELAEIIQNGENSGVEFKRDSITPEQLAKEICALLNLEGGVILLGVDDDGSVPGLTRDPKKAEEWVMEVCRVHIQPPIIPYWETVHWDGAKIVGVITLPADSPDKPYKAKRGPHWQIYIRVGSTSREASRDEEARLYQSSGLLRYDIKPVSGTTLDDLDLRRLTNYFRDIRQQNCPDSRLTINGTLEEEDRAAWEKLLLNTELMMEDRHKIMATVGGLLLFGMNPSRFLPQSAITAVAYPGLQKDYATIERAVLRGPIVALRSAGGDDLLEAGLIEQSIDFVRRNTAAESEIDEHGQRRDRWKDYPLEAIREAVINAIVHRDYSISVTDIELSIYSDRLEVISPGRLPNTVTVEKMRLGYRATRNELIKEVSRDYRYIEASGLGVPRKIVQGMLQHSGIEPDLIEEEDRFIVRLRKAP
jgi:ATP-dependent DNA helicase RecG